MANPKLTVLFEKLRGKTFELDQPSMTVGRKDEMNICIKDSSLSGFHGTFVRTDDGDYILRDENSTNGTRVNNVPVSEQKLKHLDIIQLGGVEVLYDNSSNAENASSGAMGNRTHTINLDGLDANMATVRTMTNYSPFAQEMHTQQAKTHKLFMAVLVILGLVLAVAVVSVILNIMNAPK